MRPSLFSESEQRLVSIPKTIAELNTQMVFVHLTKIIPKDGVIVPGDSLLFDTYNNYSGSAKEALLSIFNTRATLHWTINNPVESHQLSSFDDYDVAILESPDALLPYLCGGYPEDYFSLGAYLLSRDSIVIVSEQRQAEARTRLGENFKGTLIVCPVDLSVREKAKQIVTTRLGVDYPFVRFDQKVDRHLVSLLKNTVNTNDVGSVRACLENLNWRDQGQLFEKRGDQLVEITDTDAITAENLPRIILREYAVVHELFITVGNRNVLCTEYFKAWHDGFLPSMQFHLNTAFYALERILIKIRAPFEPLILSDECPAVFIHSRYMTEDGPIVLSTFLEELIRDGKKQLAILETKMAECGIPLSLETHFLEIMRIRLSIFEKIYHTLKSQDIMDKGTLENLLRSGAKSLTPVSKTHLELKEDLLTKLKKINPSVTDLAHAFRLWAAGEFKEKSLGLQIYRLEPECLNQFGKKSGSTALDFAIQRNNVYAKAYLVKWGATSQQQQEAVLAVAVSNIPSAGKI